VENEMTAEPDARPTYVRKALELFAGYADREAIVAGDRRLTYTELRAGVLDIAANLVEHGLRPGTTVAILVGFPIEAPMLQLALHLLGCRTAWISGSGSPGEQDAYLAKVRPDAFVYDARTHGQRGRKHAESLHVPAFCLGPNGGGPDVLAARPTGSAPFDVDTATGAPESVFQTSGTTGMPKPLLHTANLYEQALTLAEQIVAAGEPRYRHLTVTPLWIVSGTTSAFLYLFTGSTLVIMRFLGAREFLGIIERERINSAYVSPLMFSDLLDHPDTTNVDCSSLHTLSVGSSAITPARLRQGIERFGPVLRITYGLSESPFISAFAGIDDDPGRPGRLRSCGTTYGDVRLQIRGEDGTVLPPGQDGELWVATKLNFAGYVGMPELTAETLVDGWLRTRDIGHLDDEGYIYLTGRASDMIITGTGSIHIFPRPIEDVLATHPDVREAAVIGVPDRDRGETAHAYVVLAEGATVAEKELGDLVARKLSRTWTPRTFEFIDALPRTGSGKTNLKELRARYAAEHVETERGADERPTVRI
jgi:acyl-CoA synthetase (AMP-forming)/AMP-acid ligase II